MTKCYTCNCRFLALLWVLTAAVLLVDAISVEDQAWEDLRERSTVGKRYLLGHQVYRLRRRSQGVVTGPHCLAVFTPTQRVQLLQNVHNQQGQVTLCEEDVTVLNQLLN